MDIYWSFAKFCFLVICGVWPEIIMAHERNPKNGHIQVEHFQELKEKPKKPKTDRISKSFQIKLIADFRCWIESRTFQEELLFSFKFSFPFVPTSFESEHRDPKRERARERERHDKMSEWYLKSILNEPASLVAFRSNLKPNDRNNWTFYKLRRENRKHIHTTVKMAIKPKYKHLNLLNYWIKVVQALAS